MQMQIKYFITVEYLDTKQQLKSCEMLATPEEIQSLQENLSEVNSLNHLCFFVTKGVAVTRVYLCREVLKKCAIYLTVIQPPEKENEESVAQS